VNCELEEKRVKKFEPRETRGKPGAKVAKEESQRPKFLLCGVNRRAKGLPRLAA